MTAAAPDEFIVRDYVCAGRVELKGGGVGWRVFLLNGDDTLGAERIYKLAHRKVIGGVYRGAKFSPKQAFRIAEATYIGKWPGDAAKIAEWEANDGDLMATLKANKLEADELRKCTFDSMTIKQVRELRHAALERGDIYQATAIARFAAARIQKFVTKADA